MKKLCALILAALMALAMCACADNGANSPEPAESAPAETKDISSFDKSDGLLRRELRYNSDGLLFNTVIYEYDADGNILTETTLGVNDAPVGYKEYQREDGSLSVMISYAASGPEEYNEEYRVVYEYNDAGSISKETTLVDSAETSVTTYSYEDARLVGEQYSELGVTLSEVKYEYDENGLLVLTETSDLLEGGVTTLLNSYDDSGRLIKTESSTDGGEATVTEYAYDENGSCTSTVVTFGSETVSSTESSYEYDEPGNVVKCTRTEGDGQSSVTEYEWEYAS